MPMFADDPRLSLFKDGLWIGIFAPSQRQASITYNRIKSRIQCPTAIAVLESPEFNLEFTTSNGQTVKLSNGSFATAISASEGSNIEGESFKLIICEECFVRGTKVLTLNGEKPIEEVKVGDFVYSYNHNTGSIELKPVVRSFSQPLYGRKLVTVRSKSGKSFTCTDNHPVYIEGKGYTRADNLHIGDLMLSYTYATQGGICNGFKSDDFRFTNGGRFHCISRQEILEESEVCDKSIRETGRICLGKVPSNSGFVYSRAKDSNKSRLRKQFMSSSDSLFTCNKMVLRSLLYKGCEDCNTEMARFDERRSPCLLVHGRRFHERNDVYSYSRIFSGGKSTNSRLVEEPIWNKTNNPIRQQMWKTIPVFQGDRKKQVSTVDTSLYSGLYEIQNTYNRCRKTLCNVRKNDSTLSVKKNRDMSGMQGFIQERVLQELLSKDEIREIEIREVSEVEVFDLTVEDNHNFFAEGCLVHNCQDISNFKIRKCLTGDTKVLLADGTYKRIDSIVSDKKDDVVTFNPSMEYLTTNSPSEFYDNGIQEVYELSLDNGSSIKATLNHQFYTYDQKTRGKKCSFRTLQQIKDSLSNERPLRVGIPDRLPYFSNEGTPTDYNKGLLLGYFLGDGCLVGTPKFIGDIPTCDRLLEVIRSNVSDKVSMTEYHYNPENGMQEVCFSTPTNKKGSNPLTSMFKEFGVYGLTGDSKKLQNVLYSKSFYKGFVEGLIETDGSIECCATKPVISFANISKELVLQLKDILHRFGIHSTLFCKNNDKGFGSDSSKPLWVLNIKSICDINRFNEEFVLYRKQVYLNEAVNTISGKEDREHSKYYSDQMRFCRVKSIKYVGLEPTYCLKVKGRNFIANGMISSNSIHPMGAAYNASIIKIGTATTFKGDFYEAIQRNKREAEIRSTHRKNHFEYDYMVASKYNPSYAKYVEKEKKRLGENSDEFRMAYKLEWVIERGMFVDITKFEENNVEPLLERSFYDKNATHVVGIDLGGKGDDTVVTVVEVCWNVPAILESTINPETNEEEVYQAYNCYIKDWFRISNEPDYEVQYALIVDYLSHFNISKVLCDATREAGLSHRLRANMPFEVIPYIFTTKSKSELYKHLDREITSGRARVPGGKQTIESSEYKDFLTQLGDLQKGYSGVHLVVSHPDEKDAHDDFPDSWALAVFGCSEPGTVNTVQTSNSPFNKYGKKDSHKALQQCNRVRARRRR